MAFQNSSETCHGWPIWTKITKLSTNYKVTHPETKLVTFCIHFCSVWTVLKRCRLDWLKDSDFLITNCLSLSHSVIPVLSRLQYTSRLVYFSQSKRNIRSKLCTNISDLIVQTENIFQLSHLKQKIRSNTDIQSNSWSWIPYTGMCTHESKRSKTWALFCRPKNERQNNTPWALYVNVDVQSYYSFHIHTT